MVNKPIDKVIRHGNTNHYKSQSCYVCKGEKPKYIEQVTHKKREKKEYRTKAEIIGAFGKWILRQYLYLDYQQDGLFFPAIKQIQKALDSWAEQELDVLAIKDIKDFVRNIISVCSAIQEYNRTQNERNGGKRGSKYAFTSRFDHLKPEFDFIDLDALERNVINELIR